MSWLGHLLDAMPPRLMPAAAPARVVTLDPSAGPVYAVGDVHGCRALLQALLKVIRADAAALPGAPQVVLLGDMVDRGPDTAGLLDDLAAGTGPGGPAAIRGNHEEMMSAFFRSPKRNLGWLSLGGYETLRSYGLALDPAEAAQMPARRLAALLAAHVPQSHLDWLAALPAAFTALIDGQTFILAHAGYDPARPLTQQTERALLWGDCDLPPAPGHRLVHGHRVVAAASAAGERIAIDTGAWQTGRLTALRLCPGRAPAVLHVHGAVTTTAPLLAGRPEVRPSCRI